MTELGKQAVELVKEAAWILDLARALMAQDEQTEEPEPVELIAWSDPGAFPFCRGFRFEAPGWPELDYPPS